MLASIASELPRLIKLRKLDIEEADGAELPAELAKLPALRQLTVSASKLPRLSHLVATMPKLTKLVAIGDHATPQEKRLCAALLKLAPSKRAAAYARATS